MYRMGTNTDKRDGEGIIAVDRGGSSCSVFLKRAHVALCDRSSERTAWPLRLCQFWIIDRLYLKGLRWGFLRESEELAV